MTIMIYVFLFILGCVFGSFYMVIGQRGPLNESIVSPRSHCEKCDHFLKWYELIPVISYLFQKGRCRNCNAKVSITYPLIEIFTGLLFVLSYFVFGFSYHTIIMIIISSLLVIIYVSDFKYYVILDWPLVISAVLIIITKLCFIGYKATIISAINGLIMFIIMYLIKLFGDKVFKRESLGGGDIKLAFIIGLVLEFELALVSLFGASFIALPYAIIMVSIIKKDEMPYGPFLITSCLLVFIFSELIINVLGMLYL